MSPLAPLRPCLEPGCHSLTNQSRCARHLKLQDQHRRPAWITRFYSSKQWQTLRAMKRRHNPLCEDCLEKNPQALTPVQVVDHVLPLERYHELALTLENLRSLCHVCHEAKSQRSHAR
jgi:5-methylcytosine-specific restriction protein A